MEKRILVRIFSLFILWITVSPTIFQQILGDLSEEQKGPSFNKIHRIERLINNDLKIANFSVFFEMSLFEIQPAFLARHHGYNLDFAFNCNL